ncbi:MAG: ABC transporter ATP-binding protein/permease [Bdellovibrionales bacterium]|nr:ABC transporter ATP-binding protein/permease [Bdellovibrionales bacterium]
MKPDSTEDSVAHELTFVHLFKRLWPYLRRYKLRLLFIILLVVSFTLVGRSLPLVFGYAVDHGIKTKNQSTLIHIATLFLFLQILRSTLSLLQSFTIQDLGHRVLYSLRHRLVCHILNLPITYYDKTPSGRIMTRVTNDVYSLGELFSQGFSAIFINIFEIITLFLTLTYVSAPLTAILSVLIPPLLWSTRQLSRKIRIDFGSTKRKLAQINSFTAETINGLKVVQLFNQGSATMHSFNQLSSDYKNCQLKTVRLFATLWPVVEAFNMGSLILTITVGAVLKNVLSLSPGQLAAFVLLVQGFFRPLRSILEKYNQLQNSLASADRVFQLFDQTVEQVTKIESIHPTERDTKIHQIENKSYSGELIFQQVSFSYTDEKSVVIKNLNLKIEAGKSVALVGRTGSGKTTLISLVQKLYTPQTGQILLDGVPLSQIETHQLRSKIGVVLQDNFMFKGTVAENVSLFNSKISRKKIEQALQLACCEKLLNSHVGGLDAKIDERGSNLSVGERQLIAFARVLAFNPDILILDEATANIDSVHEKYIQNAIREIIKGRTSLIVAHRLSTIQYCDQIILLNQGEILEKGSHLQLMQSQGAYAELVKIQFQDTNPTKQALAIS